MQGEGHTVGRSVSKERTRAEMVRVRTKTMAVEIEEKDDFDTHEGDRIYRLLDTEEQVKGECLECLSDFWPW